MRWQDTKNMRLYWHRTGSSGRKNRKSFVDRKKPLLPDWPVDVLPPGEEREEHLIGGTGDLSRRTLSVSRESVVWPQVWFVELSEAGERREPLEYQYWNRNGGLLGQRHTPFLPVGRLPSDRVPFSAESLPCSVPFRSVAGVVGSFSSLSSSVYGGIPPSGVGYPFYGRAWFRIDVVILPDSHSHSPGSVYPGLSVVCGSA